MKHEQYNSLLLTRELLSDLLDPKKRPKTQKEMKDRVRRCLRHYPFLGEGGKPLFSQTIKT
jgi:hypothetical protein